ncbi:MAG: hypothetical protein PHS57_02810 [Alphaproteobacteria bacterium]|nr:hypothetical protein [Alphaproteobacteria bacterium]
MSLLPLTFGVGLSSDAKGGDLRVPSKKETESVLRKDNFTCRFCGFRAAQYQRVISCGGVFVTSCIFCEQVVFLDRAGIMGSGVLVWLPEITQVELQHLARAIYVAEVSGDEALAQAASRAKEAILARKTEAKRRLGSDDPLLLCSVLQEHLNPAERAAALEKLEGVRLFPLAKHMMRSRKRDIDAFPQIVDFWRSARGPFAELPIGMWRKLFDKIVA